jgi:hypothetical protein
MIVFIGSGKYMTMPRLSLYRPEKTSDYKFVDKTVWEMFQVGGTDVLIHKYLGPAQNAGSGSPQSANLNTESLIFSKYRIYYS